ncbi:HigA family addiction module antitoxin [Ramlibacter sp. AN1015]|uniref:HigA family addiction module antitoxin n=1 Tax=Ramlibacter sp. AN1015 TaxID=3133428 RepID=UPI0030BAF3E9
MDESNTLNEYRPDYAVPPGEVLVAELEMRGMTQHELALRTGLTPKHIVSIAKAKSAITSDTAIKLERALGMPAQYWLNLESNYQEVLSRLAEEEKLERDRTWLKKVPVTEMIKRGWIAKAADAKAQLVEVLRFFGIASVDQWDDMWPNLAVAYRQHVQGEISPEAVSAWLRRGELEASKISCAPFDRSAFRTALAEIRSLTCEAPEVFVPRLASLCAEAGVAVVFVPALPKTGVSGATRWLTPTKALIQLSLRYRTDDHLWFTFFHEAGHILLHGKKECFLEGANGLDEAKEHEANEFAENELISRKEFAAFSARPIFSKAAIVAFARQVGISPGVVVGQLQYKKLLPPSHCNDLKMTFTWTQ